MTNTSKHAVLGEITYDSVNQLISDGTTNIYVNSGGGCINSSFTLLSFCKSNKVKVNMAAQVTSAALSLLRIDSENLTIEPTAYGLRHNMSRIRDLSDSFVSCNGYEELAFIKDQLADWVWCDVITKDELSIAIGGDKLHELILQYRDSKAVLNADQLMELHSRKAVYDEVRNALNTVADQKFPVNLTHVLS